ncbi:hypothetical protein SAMD00019534_059270, partial [Acytostelium subglobosum LB1]|uniref:hypothetical protein n=1 Tax=Acytostelium subglobosum LB1 TaxID=1410327 RepID=UPI000644C270
HRRYTNININNNKSDSIGHETIGQPTHFTHPHLLNKGELIKGITLEEFKLRRFKLSQLLPEGTCCVIMTPPEPMMSYDIPYHFRQQSNFYYFTGLNEPEAILVVERLKGNDYRTTMFLREKDAAREIWDGPRCGTKLATSIFGVDQAYDVKNTNKLIEVIKDSSDIFVNINGGEWPAIVTALSKQKISNFNIEKLLQYVRLIKSDAEIAMMEQSGGIAGDSFAELMRYIQPGMNEHEVSAYFEYAIKRRGAQRMSYPPVVAGGNRANIIHYVANNMILKNGDLCLMDAGAEYWGFTSDITRTFPVNGRFTQAQREVYEAVLDVNKRCIPLCVAGSSINKIHLQSVRFIVESLQRLGILSSEKSVDELIKDGSYHKYYPHNIGHFLGMDTHDCPDVSYGETLANGMIITIEPGIYISDTDMDVDPKYRGIAIRVEDDVALTDNGPLVLTKNAPKEVKDIESLMECCVELVFEDENSSTS